MAMKSILEYDTVSLSDDGTALVIIDQTLLPGEIKLLHLTGQNEIWEAIQALRVWCAGHRCGGGHRAVFGGPGDQSR